MYVQKCYIHFQQGVYDEDKDMRFFALRSILLKSTNGDVR
jgi:hypothetical protein